VTNRGSKGTASKLYSGPFFLTQRFNFSELLHLPRENLLTYVKFCKDLISPSDIQVTKYQGSCLIALL